MHRYNNVCIPITSHTEQRNSRKTIRNVATLSIEESSDRTSDRPGPRPRLKFAGVLHNLFFLKFTLLY